MTTTGAEVVRHPNGPSAEVIEQVVIAGDLSKLTPAQRGDYYSQVCASVGLNPLTRPFDYITLNGKLTLYARKDATDQLRDRKHVSVRIVGREQVGDLYVVTARAQMPNGREDESTGVVSLTGLKAEALANALMKAETKAKRRVTLSICGLGWLDESEIEDATTFGTADEVAVAHAQLSEPQPLKVSEPEVEAESDGQTGAPGIRVKSVRVAKTGKNDKGDWKLYVITLSDEQEYTTFSETVAARAKSLLSQNATVTFEYEEKNGKRNLILLEEVQ